ncbi:MAG: hypothetical protein QOG80_1893 [Pseudonocardiales bacterium]|jgi:hypothetical protein|nr:hypothetical protein [Pseudonocardiales bacterium]
METAYLAVLTMTLIGIGALAAYVVAKLFAGQR